MFRILLPTAFFILCTACSSTSSQPSEALRVASAMGVPAKDLSKEDWEKSAANQGYSARAAARGELVVSSLQSWAAGNPTAFLVSGFGPKKIESSVHIVAWIPEDHAKSPESAKQLAEKTLQKARADVLAKSDKEHSDISNQKIKYIMTMPYGESGPIHAVKQLKQLAIGANPELSTPPDFMREGNRAYGPIFLDINGGITAPEEIETITRISSRLPKWIYIYNPGIKGAFPNTIINQGHHYLFVRE